LNIKIFKDMRKRNICFYFQVHQPFRLRTYRFFDIGAKHDYYDEYANRSIMRKVSEKCYLPANRLLLDLIKEYGTAFKLSFSISGSALDQFEMYAPDVLESFQMLAHTNNVEFLAETNAHSLCALRSKEEFKQQVQTHARRIEKLFGHKPKAFRNTELIYSDDIGETVEEMGYKLVLTEGAKHILGWKSPNYMYCSVKNPKLKILMKNYKLSDDIAFRFSNKSWQEYPLTAEKYGTWLNQLDHLNETVNIFMDYETFGEHQHAETGIFEFLRALPRVILSHTDYKFSTPSELLKELQPVSPVSVPYPISWADEERDITAWLGNELQNEAFSQLFTFEEKIKQCNDESLIRDWNRLQNSDHFYYMCTKWFSDGEVHKYFNPYNSPYEAFINYMNVLSDFMSRVNEFSALNNIMIPPPVEKDDEKKIEPKEPSPKKEGKKNPISKTVTKQIDKKRPQKAVKSKEKTKKSKTKEKPEKSLKKKKKEPTFDTISELPDFIIKELVNKADLHTLCVALKNVDEDIKDILLSYMGIRKLKLFEEETAKIEKTGGSSIIEAQNNIIAKIKEIINRKNNK